METILLVHLAIFVPFYLVMILSINLDKNNPYKPKKRSILLFSFLWEIVFILILFIIGLKIFGLLKRVKDYLLLRAT